MQKKTMLFISIAALSLLLFAGGIYIGSLLNGKQQEQAEYCTIDRIAVVNMDQGVEENGKKINYALELAGLPDVNFEYAGLEEARQGLEQNRYAAWILLPADFSRSVSSINQTPEKAPIEYRLNPMLQEDMALQIFSEVLLYLQTINDNMSYLYVDAILAEFHKAQEGAGTVMQNDTLDMESISALDSEELLAPLEPVQAQYPENIISPVDLETQYAEMERLTEQIEDTYQNGYSAAAKEWETIREQETEVKEKLVEFCNSFDEINIRENNDGQLVYETGLQEIETLMEDARKASEEKRQAIRDTLKWEKEPEVPPDAARALSLQELAEANNQQIKENNETIKQQITKIKAILGESPAETPSVSSGEESSEEENSEDAEEETADEITLTEEEKEELAEALATIEDSLPEEDVLLHDIETGIGMIEENLNQIEEFPAETLQTLVDEKVLAPVEQEIEEEQQRLNTERDKVETLVTDYSDEITGYDPFSHVDTDAVAQLNGQIKETAEGMEQELNRTGSDYLAFTDEVYDKAQEHTEQLQNNLETAYGETGDNLLQAVQNAQNNRSSIHEQNMTLLMNFTESLPYTKKGSMEYRDMYDFVVSPIEIKGSYESIGQGAAARSAEKVNKVLLMVTVLEGLLLAAGIVFYTLQGKNIEQIE